MYTCILSYYTVNVRTDDIGMYFDLGVCLQVASTVGRAEVLCSIFFILSFLAYVKAILKSPTVLNSSKESTSWLQILLSVLLAVLALLSKEQGITVLGVSIVFDVLLHWPVIMKAISVITVSKTGREGRNGIMEASHCSAIVNESNTSNGHIRSTASLPSICQESVQAVVRRIGR